MQYESLITSGLKVMAKVKVFFKVGQTSRSRSLGQKLWYHVKGLVTRNTHMKYERCITSGLEVMAKVKVFVHADDADADADADADGRAMTLAPRTYMSRLAKNDILSLRTAFSPMSLKNLIKIYEPWFNNGIPSTDIPLKAEYDIVW